MQLQKKLNEVEYKVAKELIDEQKSKVEKVNLTQVALTNKERNEIIDLRICLDILSDCMESFVMDINEILQRHDKTLTFEEYNPTIKMLKEARRHLSWCSDNTEYRKYEPWGDECDKLIKPNATTRICICKYPDDVNKSKYDEVKKVDNLSDILATIPKTIQFEADANADATKEAEIKLGHQYTITPKYNVSAPLAFDAGAQITYRDTLDGWNDDIKDCELAEGSYIELMSDIENKLPAYLKLSSNAIDVDGNEIAKELIEVKVSNMIEASTDGTIAKTTPVTITISEKKKGMLTMETILSLEKLSTLTTTPSQQRISR